MSDAQVTQLKDTETKLKDTNAPLLKSVDSLIREIRSAGSSPNDQARARSRDARGGLMEVLKDLTKSYDTPVKDLLGQLDADQQSKAKELLEKQREEGDKMLREKLGGGGERP